MKHLVCCASILALPFLASTQTTLQKVLNSIKNSSNNNAKSQTTNNGNQARSLPLSVDPNGLKVGDIAFDAVYVDADRLSGFSGGAAVIYKGSSIAIIDAKGKAVVPYNKYTSITAVSPHSKSSKAREINFDEVKSANSGFFIVGYPDGILLNAQGKTIASGVSTGSVFNNGKYVLVGTAFYDRNGTKYSPLKQYESVIDVNDDIVFKMRPGSSSRDKSHYSYCKMTGETITNEDFDEAYGFSDGMALVGKNDEFGQIKYGFIDKTGKLAIPYKYSIKPGFFLNGLAPIYPKDNSQFYYALINKKDEAVFHVTNTYVSQVGEYDEHINVWKGWAFLNCCYVLDSLAKKVYSMQEFLKANDINVQYAQNMPTVQTGAGAFLFLAQKFANSQGFANGALNLEKKFVINPIFDNQLFFDPVSHLAYARITTNKGYREGYINEYGVFVILKKEASQF